MDWLRFVSTLSGWSADRPHRLVVRLQWADRANAGAHAPDLRGAGMPRRVSLSDRRGLHGDVRDLRRRAAERPPSAGRRSRGSPADDGCATPPGTRRPGISRRARDSDRRSSAQHRRRRWRAPTCCERGPDDLGRPERRALQPRHGSRGSRSAGPRLLERMQHRDPAASLRTCRRRHAASRQRKVCVRRVGSRTAPNADRPRPARGRALLRVAGDLLVFASELESVLASGLSSPSSTWRRSTRISRSGSSPTRNTPRRRAKAPARSPLIVDREASIERYWEYPSPDPRQAWTARPQLSSLRPSTRRCATG